MPNYSYLAIDKFGKEKKGNREGSDERAVEISLRNEGLIPIKIGKDSIFTRDLDIHFGKLVKPRELSVFCRQFVSIVQAGVTILDALRMLGEQTESKHLKRGIKEVQRLVEKGESFSDALKTQPKIFPPLLINMVEAGESSGKLDVAFERMATHFEKQEKLKGQIKKAMVYPVAVAVVAVCVVIFLMLVVIPKFEDMFADMNVTMPPMTQMVLNASRFMMKRWYLMLAIVIAIIAGVRTFKKSSFGEEFFARLALRIPLYGKLVIKTASASFSRTLGTLMTAGVPLVEAIEITANTMDNLLVKRALMDVKEQVMRGVPMSEPLKSCGLFPPMVYHMVGIGEETGNMEQMLDKIADYYEEEVEIATSAVMAAIEPLIIVVLAVLIGVVVVAILQPMMSMYDGIENM